MTIGEKLKRERKKLGYNLDNVAKVTKIAKMFLIAIENDELSSLPGGVYTRNFLREYAKYLNLDEDIITAEYHEQYDVKPHFVLHQEQTKRDDSQFKRKRSHFFLIVFLCLLILAAVIAVIVYFPFWEAGPENTGAIPVTENYAAAQSATDRGEPAGGKAVKARKSPLLKGDPESNVAHTPAVGGGDDPKETLVADHEQEKDRMWDVGQEQPKKDANPVSSSNNKRLPFQTIEAIEGYIEEQKLDPSVFYGQADRMGQIFAIEALGPVHIEVYIEGDMATRRKLWPGQIRFYRYGNFNRVIISDISLVNVQDGEQFFTGLGQVPKNVFLNDFVPGGLLARLRESLQSEN